MTDHHAIIPTKEIVNEKLSGINENERKILYLLANRLLTATATKHKYEQIKAIVLIDDMEFSISVNAVIDMGFKLQEEMLKDYLKSTYRGRFKPDEDNEEPKLDDPFDRNSVSEELKHLAKEQVITVTNEHVKEGFTKPSLRYTESSLLSAMEHAGSKEMERNQSYPSIRFLRIMRH